MPLTDINLDQLAAIDVHTHVNTSVHGPSSGQRPAEDALHQYFNVDTMPTLPEMIDYYQQRRMAFIAFTVDNPGFSGAEPPVSNEEIAEIAASAPDVVIPFASVDPGRGAAGARAARRLIEDHHVCGFKFHPSMQTFYPNDRAAYPLYEVIAEHQLPAIFHTGQTGVGAGKPGGAGIRMKYANPLYLDDVAVDFSHMPIIMAHPSVPWQDEALAVALHKPQVYIDLSGWSPKYFPPQLVHYANTLLKHKVLFGSDFPVITPDRWLTDFETLQIKPEVRQLILKDNAARLLNIPT